MDPDLDDLIDALQARAGANPQRYFFNLPTSTSDLDGLEADLGIRLPRSYRRFLERCNGGFITLLWDTTDELWDRETAEWNSNQLLGTDAIRAAYDDLQAIHDGWEGQYPEWKGQWPYIPLCHTSGQEWLVFRSGSADAPESPIYDAFHEVWPEEWGVLYHSFRDLLSDYLQREGRIDTVAKSPER